VTQKKAYNGQIWRAKVLVPARLHSNEKARRVVIEKGELVEFRFWSPANVRVRGEIYLTIEETEFYENFEYIGKIFEAVYSRNQNTTAEIIDGRLYTEESE
jgi:hypothetical protein